MSNLQKIKAAAAKAQAALEQAEAENIALLERFEALRDAVPRAQWELDNLHGLIEREQIVIKGAKEWLSGSAASRFNDASRVPNVCRNIMLSERIIAELTDVLPIHEQRLKDAQSELADFIKEHGELEAQHTDEQVPQFSMEMK